MRKPATACFHIHKKDFSAASPAIVLIVAFYIACGCAGKPPVSSIPTTSPTPPSYTRAVIIERYDQHGRWRDIPRKAILSGESANHLGNCFPELKMERRMPLLLTLDPMRFEITLTQTDGKEVTLWVNAELSEWWDERNLYRLRGAATDALLELETHEDESLLIKASPIVQAEITEWTDEFMRRRKIPTKKVLTGFEAEFLAKQFPEIGLKRTPQGAGAGIVNRYYIIFTRANGERVSIGVEAADPGAKWIWSEGQSHWELQGGAGLTFLMRDAKEDPSTTQRSTTKP